MICNNRTDNVFCEAKQLRIKAVCFDIGQTLIGYNKPLNWQTHYRSALIKVLNGCSIDFSEDKIQTGIEVLTKYNTRVNYRETEVASDVIFGELLDQWQVGKSNLQYAKDAFFSYFQADAQPFPDAESLLCTLKGRGIQVGVLTDVAYGMDNEFSLKDIASIIGYIDFALTSRDVGFRKPNKAGFLKLLDLFGVHPHEMLFVGDEEKDIVGANQLCIPSVLINRGDELKEYGQTYTITKLIELLEFV